MLFNTVYKHWSQNTCRCIEIIYLTGLTYIITSMYVYVYKYIYYIYISKNKNTQKIIVHHDCKFL